MSAAIAATALFPPDAASTSFPDATPTEAPHTPHAAHAAHPIPLREQAFTLHCQGLRSPAIARELAVPERTVRAWIAAALDELKDDQSFSRREQLLIAVERQHALTVAAWQQFEAETAARTALLDAAQDAFLAAATADASPAVQVPRLPASTPAPRYLSLILQANKETNRLLGLYSLARLDLLPDAAPASPASATDNDPAAESATLDHPSPAASATATTALDIAAASATLNHHVPAISATASAMSHDAAASATAVAASEPAATSASTASAPPSSAHRVPATSATTPALLPAIPRAAP